MMNPKHIDYRQDGRRTNLSKYSGKHGTNFEIYLYKSFIIGVLTIEKTIFKPTFSDPFADKKFEIPSTHFME